MLNILLGDLNVAAAAVCVAFLFAVTAIYTIFTLNRPSPIEREKMLREQFRLDRDIFQR